MFSATTAWQDKSVHQQVFEVEGQERALLGRPVMCAPDTLSHLQAVGANKQTQVIWCPLGKNGVLPTLCKTCSNENYEVRLKANATPYALTRPRRVAV